MRHQAVAAKKRLESAMQDQRRLAQQVGKLEAAKRVRLKALGQPPTKNADPWNSGSPEPSNSGWNLVKQQTELAKARREIERLQSAQSGAESDSQQKAQNLVTGLESEILALARKIETYEKQLTILGVAMPGPYEDTLLHSRSETTFDLTPSALLWVLQEWHYGNEIYLRDPLNNGIYAYNDSQNGHKHACWPCPVGLVCAGQLFTTPPGQALHLFLSLSQAGGVSNVNRVHQILVQAAASPELAVDALEKIVQHRVAPSDVSALMACLATDTAAMMQLTVFAHHLKGICTTANDITTGNCMKLMTARNQIETALEQRSEEALRLLFGKEASTRVQYFDVVKWFRALEPALNSEEIWAGLLWLRTWDLHAHGSLQPTDVLRAFRFGAVWLIRPESTMCLQRSLHAAANVKQMLQARQEVAQLEETLRTQEDLLHRQETEIASLKARLGEARSLLDKQQQQMEGSGEDKETELAALRLKYLKAKSSLESVVASNAKLIKDLDRSKAELAALQLKSQLHNESGEENGMQSLQPNTACCGMDDFQLKQQLISARHAVAQLQIELEAARSKLAIYRLHPLHSSKSLHGKIKAVRIKQPYHQQGKAECIDRQMKHERNITQMELVQEFAEMGCTGCAIMEVPEELRGLPDDGNIVELHIHSAALESHVTGPQGMTFITVDFYQHETQMTPVLEGAFCTDTQLADDCLPTDSFNSSLCQFNIICMVFHISCCRTKPSIQYYMPIHSEHE